MTNELSLKEAAEKGFEKKDFSAMYYYLIKVKGLSVADAWIENNDKEGKKLYCARIIASVGTNNAALEQKVEKYLEKCRKKGLI